MRSFAPIRIGEEPAENEEEPDTKPKTEKDEIKLAKTEQNAREAIKEMQRTDQKAYETLATLASYLTSQEIDQRQLN